MINLHGLILADRSSRDLRELVMCRTSSSLPFAGRYRLIDFALSNLQNAGVRDVGVVMQRNYSSLLDHIGSAATSRTSSRTTSPSCAGTWPRA